MALDLSKHPCFNGDVCHQVGRVHLPVAPKCNVQCNFCNRKYDCVNESRPGVSSTLLAPTQALDYLNHVMKQDPRITVVGIAGPGDAFANGQETMETIRLVRANYPDLLLCIATNGLNVGPYINELAELEVTHVSITVNAVDPAIGAKVYGWVRHNKKIYRGIEAGRLMLEKQMEAIAALHAHGIIVKINSIVVPGVNDHHITEISKVASEQGADILNCIPLCPVAETPFANCGEPDTGLMEAIRSDAEHHMAQMRHCTRCRADAIGLLSDQMTEAQYSVLQASASGPLNPAESRPYVAVASREGLLVNQHLGEALDLQVYEYNGSTIELVEQRDTPVRGSGDQRWQAMAQVLSDCQAVLTNGVGPKPQAALKANGIKTIVTEGLIEENLMAFFNGEPLANPVRAFECGVACVGDGTGCG